MKIEIEHHNNFPSPFGFKTFLKYYPTRYEVSEDYRDNRRVVYSFKDGDQLSYVDDLFVKAINELKTLKKNIPFWLCTIPSSTIERTESRYSDFCERVSTKSAIHNGYNLLTPIENRDEVHKGGKRNYDHVLSCIKFNTSISGKNIILIDDVITTGKSFRLISAKIKQMGASSVFGIMLAKTHWLEDDNDFIPEEDDADVSDPPNVPPDLEYREPLDDDFYII